MKKLIAILAFTALWAGFFSLPVLQTGCAHQVTLESGGVYSDATLATTDQAILTAAQTLDGFVQWNDSNSAFLARYPEVGALAENVRANKKTWILNAYAARDIYADAAKKYKEGQGASPTTAGIAAALSVINDVTVQINAYRAAHPITS